MPFSDILLHLDSYPDPTPHATISSAVSFAAILGGHLTALGFEVALPVRSNVLADYLIGLSALSHTEEGRSRDQCRASLESFSELALSQAVPYATEHECLNVLDAPDRVALRARTRDLTILPLREAQQINQEVARAVLFGSGRPVLLFSDAIRVRAIRLDTVVVAWDGSRSAARAMADAMPILGQAKSVTILTVAGDKPGVEKDRVLEPKRHLAAHGIACKTLVVDRNDGAIGAVLEHHLNALGADLLVMGAFGHSRLQEFILGGATQHMLSRPTTPVLMSH